MSDIKKVVLAYSGGLDTSVILKWLQDVYKCEVVTFTADLGQGEELEPARAKALKAGIKPKNIYIDDVREEFVRDFVFPMFRANTVYEGEYLLGTSIARPLIAKRLIEIVNETGADAICHGATGKGNDQVRFELGAYALKPGIKVIAPWREWDLMSREKLMAYAEKHGIEIDMKHKKGGSPYSMDANLLHISYEGRHLENPAAEAEESMWRWTVSPEKAPNKAEYLDLEFAKGDVVAINGKKMKAHEVLGTLNEIGGKHGIGRLDLVENRYVGMKSRGCYETPGGTILLRAHRAIESVTLDREVAHLKDDLMPRYASLVYNGYWWSPERKALQVLIDHTQGSVNGVVRLKLYKGNVIVVGRDSATDSLFDSTIATFEDDAGAYDQRDAGGFIKLNALRMRIAANLAAKKAGKPVKKTAAKKVEAAKPAAKAAVKPAAKPAAKKAVAKPAAKPVVKAAAKPLVKPVAAKAVVAKAVKAPAKAAAKKPAAKKKG
jgi:argininosuccinate synthase